jgi:hypothetical protein
MAGDSEEANIDPATLRNTAQHNLSHSSLQISRLTELYANEGFWMRVAL